MKRTKRIVILYAAFGILLSVTLFSRAAPAWQEEETRGISAEEFIKNRPVRERSGASAGRASAGTARRSRPSPTYRVSNQRSKQASNQILPEQPSILNNSNVPVEISQLGVTIWRLRGGEANSRVRELTQENEEAQEIKQQAGVQ